jgi:tetratricopeptide (TPR) repeat protein
MMAEGKENVAIWMRRRHLFIALFAVLIYLPTIGFDYTLDDAIVIYKNAYTTQGVKGIPDLFKYDSFRGFFQEEGKENLVAGGRYRPLTLMMFALEWELAGRSPWLSHLINALLYGLLAYVLLLFLETLPFARKDNLFLTIGIGLLFIAHPIHTEVVANIKGRDEILAFILGMSSLILLQGKRSLLAAVFFFLALLAKEMALTWLPIGFLILLIQDRWSILTSIKRTLPLLFAFIAYLAVRFSVLGWPSSSVEVYELMNNPFLKVDGFEYQDFTLSEKLGSIFYSLYKYVALLLFPHPLTHDYYPRSIPVVSFFHILSITGMLIHLVLVLLGVRWYKKNPLASFMAAFYLISLLLICNALFPIGTHMGERFLFMGSLGFVGLIAWGLSQIKNKRLAWSLLGIITLLYTAKTLHRSQTWKDDYTLFTTDVLTSKQSAKALNAAAGAMFDRCVEQLPEPCDEDHLKKALSYSEEAIEIHPNYKNAHLIKGNLLLLLERYEESIKSYNYALSIDPSWEEARKNLIIAYTEGAKHFGEKLGDTQKALNLLRQANALSPDNREVIRLLGVVHGVQGQFEKALSYFIRLSQLDPQNPETYRNIGITYLRMGKEAEGNQYLQKAEALDDNE